MEHKMGGSPEMEINMREINNTPNSKIEFKGGIAPAKKTNDLPEVPNPQSEVVTDLRNVPSDTLGRSQVKKTTGVESDIHFLGMHPEDVERADRYMQYLMEKQGMNYEQAATLATEFAREFS